MNLDVETPSHTQGARTLARGLQLLEWVAASPDGARVSDLAVQTGLDRGTVSRLLGTLRDAGYIRQRPTDRRYSLSSKLTRLSQGYLAQIDLRGVAHAALVALRDEVNETIHLAIVEGNRTVYTDQLEPERSVRATSAIGQVLPLHVTAMGRAILAAMPASERKPIQDHLVTEYLYDSFIRDKARLDEEIALAESRGWATVDRGDDVTRIGAAILDNAGTPVGAISISGPTYRVGPDLNAYGARCFSVAQSIQRAYNA